MIFATAGCKPFDANFSSTALTSNAKKTHDDQSQTAISNFDGGKSLPLATKIVEQLRNKIRSGAMSVEAVGRLYATLDSSGSRAFTNKFDWANLFVKDDFLGCNDGRLREGDLLLLSRDESIVTLAGVLKTKPNFGWNRFKTAEWTTALSEFFIVGKDESFVVANSAESHLFDEFLVTCLRHKKLSKELEVVAPKERLIGLYQDFEYQKKPRILISQARLAWNGQNSYPALPCLVDFESQCRLENSNKKISFQVQGLPNESISIQLVHEGPIGSNIKSEKFEGVPENGVFKMQATVLVNEKLHFNLYNSRGIALQSYLVEFSAK